MILKKLNNVKDGSKRFEEGSLVPKFLSIWQPGIASYRFKSVKNDTIDDEKIISVTKIKNLKSLFSPWNHLDQIITIVIIYLQNL